MRILLLQGSVGWFFAKLAKAASNKGHHVQSVCFNAGDALFAPKQNRQIFKGGAKEWKDEILQILKRDNIDAIVLFGAQKPIHKIAIKAANNLGIKCLCLEEGYIRTGFITAEYGANNMNSPIAGSLAPDDWQSAKNEKEPATYKSFKYMAAFAFLYYFARSIFPHTKGQKQLFHRKPKAGGWIKNAAIKLLKSKKDSIKINDLTQSHANKYFLAALQVSDDANMKGDAALGWDSSKLIHESCASFAKFAPKNARLVFKIHPLERGHSNAEREIKNTAKACGIGERVDVINCGSLGALVKRCAGMVTISSTSGLSAIYHGARLMVIGNTIYSNQALANCAHGNPDWQSFWQCKIKPANKDIRLGYISWIKEKCLVRGDFYNPKGMESACHNVLEKLSQ